MDVFIAATLFAWGVASYSFVAVVHRLHSTFRVKMYAWFVSIPLVVLLTFALTRVLQASEALIGSAALLIGQTFAFGTHVWMLQLDVLNDPRWREEEGLPQYEGRTRRYWEVRLWLSPWDIIKYHRYARSDPNSPARKYREQQR